THSASRGLRPDIPILCASGVLLPDRDRFAGRSSGLRSTTTLFEGLDLFRPVCDRGRKDMGRANTANRRTTSTIGTLARSSSWASDYQSRCAVAGGAM